MATIPYEFDRVAEALNEVRLKCPTLPVLSILWIHPKHPVHPVQRALMSGLDVEPGGLDSLGGSPFVDLARRMSRSKWVLARAFICLINAFRLCGKLISLQWRFRRPIRELRAHPFSIVVKTWCFGPRRFDDDVDFYYGDLQSRLSRRGVSMLLLCGDTTESDWNQFAQAHVSTSDKARLPELCLVPCWAPLWMAFDQIRTVFKLRKLRSEESDALTARVHRFVSRDCVSPVVTQTGLYFWLGQAVAKTWDPRVLLTLYEGHGWEKAMWWGAKLESRRCQTVGYQHTAVFPEALSLTKPFVDVPERSLPDLVLALGEETATLMRDGHVGHGARVMRFGSFREQGPVVDAPSGPGARCVLVLPEGIGSEIELLFSFAFECASALPGYTFVLRSHPNWPMEKALGLVPTALRDRPNVVISDRDSIADDFRRASAILYRGSSTVFFGILHGLLPVCLKTDSMWGSDPLYALDSWRRRCTSTEGFVREMARYESRSPGDLEAEWRGAVRYIRNYVMPVGEESIDRFSEATGLTGRGR